VGMVVTGAGVAPGTTITAVITAMELDHTVGLDLQSSAVSLDMKLQDNNL
jgi:hypothetical protein